MTRSRMTPLVLAAILAACTTSAQQKPEIVASATVAGRSYPQSSSAGTPFVAPTRVAPSETYGYRAEEPVVVGGESESHGPQRSRLYLSSLRSPGGEVISYQRRGSCCPFATPHSDLGGGMLDVYEVTTPAWRSR